MLEPLQPRPKVDSAVVMLPWEPVGERPLDAPGLQVKPGLCVGSALGRIGRGVQLIHQTLDHGIGGVALQPLQCVVSGNQQPNVVLPHFVLEVLHNVLCVVWVHQIVQLKLDLRQLLQNFVQSRTGQGRLRTANVHAGVSLGEEVDGGEGCDDAEQGPQAEVGLQMRGPMGVDMLVEADVVNGALPFAVPVQVVQLQEVGQVPNLLHPPVPRQQAARDTVRIPLSTMQWARHHPHLVTGLAVGEGAILPTHRFFSWQVGEFLQEALDSSRHLVLDRIRIHGPKDSLAVVVHKVAFELPHLFADELRPFGIHDLG
mmetsp:Transcript_13593/g.24230  ORF Transcript_13593/g.24230 Transcript_13593/m.24230 type:complete len:314 (+) Transcript_13593:3030-3971(+)